MFRVPGHLGTRGPMARTPHHGSAALALGVVVVLLLAGCGDGGTEDPGPRAHVTTSTTQAAAPSSTASDVSTSTPSTPEEQVKAAYLRITKEYFTLIQQPDPTASVIDSNYVGAALKSVRDENSRYALNEWTVRFPKEPPVPEILGVQVDGGEATISTCIVDDSQLVRASDGAIVDNDVVSKLFDATLRLVNGRWLLESQERIQSWPDAAGCRG